MTRIRKWLAGVAAGLGLFAVAGEGAQAAALLIGDSTGHLAWINPTTGVVSRSLGVSGTDGTLFDIAMAPNGTLYGLTARTFYSIDTNTGQATSIGRHGIRNGNALEFDGAGTAFAMGRNNTKLYTIDTGSGAATAIGGPRRGAGSSGDLAFDGSGNLYLAGYGRWGDSLMSVDTTTGAQTTVGGTGVVSLYGLAYFGGVMYAAAGTNIYAIDLATGGLGTAVSFAGQGITSVYGATAVTPVPGAVWLFGSGLLGLLVFARPGTRSSA
jgi:hypothetical protein